VDISRKVQSFVSGSIFLFGCVIVVCLQVLTSAAQTKAKLNAHFESLHQCVNEALSDRLAVLQQSVDDAVQEAIVPLDGCQQEIQQKVDVAVNIMDTGE